MKRTAGLCLVFGLLAVGGLLALFVLPGSSRRELPDSTHRDGGVQDPDVERPGPPGRTPGPGPAGGTTDPNPAEPGAFPASTSRTGRVVGRVVGADGNPVVGALVYLAPWDDPAMFRDETLVSTRTGDDGAFSFEVPALASRFLVYQPGFRPGGAEGTVTGGAVLDLGTITLDPGLSISGRIVDTGGRPVAGAEAVAYRNAALASPALLPGPTGAGEWGGRARADERGDYRVPGLGEGKYFLRAEGIGLVMDGEPVAAAAGASNVNLVVRRVRVATGVVVSERDPETIVPGATVTLTLRTEAWGTSLIVQTDETGRFVLDLSETRYSDPELRIDVAIAADGYEDLAREGLALADLAPAAALTLPLVPGAPQEPGRLRGRVLYDTGAPFVGWMTLSFSRAGRPAQVFRTETGPDGAFLIEGITPGEYELRTAPRNGRILQDTGKRLVIPAGGEERADLTLPRGGDIDLTVVDPRGDPVRDAEVEVLDGEGETLGAWNAPTGALIIPDLSPGGAKVRVSAPGFRAAEAAVGVTKDVRTPLRVVLDPR